MLTAAVSVILAGSVLWGYNGQSENLTHPSTVVKTAIKATHIKHRYLAVTSNTVTVEKNDSALLVKSTVNKEAKPVIVVAVTNNNVTVVPSPLNNADEAFAIIADDEQPTPLNESMVMAYASAKPAAVATPFDEAMVMSYHAQKNLKLNWALIVH